MYNNKKGQSEIITTVLIILLVLAAIVIVWQVVRSTVTTGANQITGGTDCITLGFDITRADKTYGDITVKRLAGAGDLKYLKVLINGVTRNDSADASSLKELESTRLYINNTPSTAALASNDKVEVAAVLGTLGNNKVCNIASTKTVA